jgi:hypothetical protein
MLCAHGCLCASKFQKLSGPSVPHLSTCCYHGTYSVFYTSFEAQPEVQFLVNTFYLVAGMVEKTKENETKFPSLGI